MVENKPRKSESCENLEIIFLCGGNFTRSHIIHGITTFSAAYGFLYLPPNVKSYEHKSTYDHSHEVSVVPLILFCLCRYFSIGATLVPLTMLGELFPLRIRSMATGFTTAVGNIETFIAIKTFYDYERWTSLPGTFCIYAILGALGYLSVQIELSFIAQCISFNLLCQFFPLQTDYHLFHSA